MEGNFNILISLNSRSTKFTPWILGQDGLAEQRRFAGTEFIHGSYTELVFLLRNQIFDLVNALLARHDFADAVPLSLQAEIEALDDVFHDRRATVILRRLEGHDAGILEYLVDVDIVRRRRDV